MLLAFCDETERETFFSFAALIADEQATKALTASLTKIMDDAWWAYDLVTTSATALPEFHGQPLFQGRGAFKNLEPRVRIGLYQKVLDAIVAEDVTILLRSINKAKLREHQERRNYANRHPPEQECLTHILQRVQIVARRKDAYALLIADERGDRERHRERFALYQTMGTPGVYMNSNLDRLLDTIHFAPSHHSRMLQAADMLAFLYGRHVEVQESDARQRAVMEKFWATLVDSGKLYDVGSWPWQ